MTAPAINERCQRCDFVPIDMCQLDVDHIDGTNSNNDPSNYITLCANCQRLKMKMNGDHLTPREHEGIRHVWRQGDLFN